jgi:DNA polymerase-3 subunit delta
VLELRPAYLIHGEDHGAVAERRGRLRALVEGEEGAAGVELLEGDAATPVALAAALATMTLAVGRRVIIVEGVERWRDGDVQEHLLAALERIAPDTTVALFAREDARTKAPQALHRAVEQAGGQVVAHATVKPWELPRWVREQAPRLGLTLDAAAAKALVDHVGERQQRLLRELEKLALEGDEGGTAGAPRPVSAGEIEARAAHSAERRAFELADALVADAREEAMRAYVRLRGQGERPAGLVYIIAGRLRDAVAVAARLAEGTPVAEIRRGLRGSAKAKARFVADVAASEPRRITGAFAALADLELDSRGGAPVQASRTSVAGLDEDTLAVRAIEAITR